MPSFCHKSPDTHLHPLHPLCSLFFTSLMHHPLLWMVDYSYLNSSSFTFSTFWVFTLSFTHVHSVLRPPTFILFSQEHTSTSPVSSHSLLLTVLTVSDHSLICKHLNTQFHTVLFMREWLFLIWPPQVSSSTCCLNHLFERQPTKSKVA